MKPVSFPQSKSKRLYFLSFLSLAALMFSLTVVWQIGHAQQALSLADILIGLRSKKVTLEERNKMLTDAVKARGVTFTLTPEIEKELETTGADKGLVEAVREKSVVVKVAATPAPVAVATPAPTPTPQDSEYYQRLGDSHMVKGEYDLAVTDYNKSIELNPKDSLSYLSRGLSYYNKKAYDLAIADFDKGIALDPKESMSYYNRGNSFEKMGEFQKAITDYQKAVEMDASNEPAKESLQRLQAEQARYAPKPQPQTVALTSGSPKSAPETKQEKPEKLSEPKAEKTEKAKTPPPTAQPDPAKPVDLGQLNGVALSLVTPTYPEFARKTAVQGLVNVQVTINEEGKVISAKATSGPAMLRGAAEEAARRSKFKPPTADNQPVKATGFISYNFRSGI